MGWGSAPCVPRGGDLGSLARHVCLGALLMLYSLHSVYSCSHGQNFKHVRGGRCEAGKVSASSASLWFLESNGLRPTFFRAWHTAWWRPMRSVANSRPQCWHSARSTSWTLALGSSMLSIFPWHLSGPRDDRSPRVPSPVAISAAWAGRHITCARSHSLARLALSHITCASTNALSDRALVRGGLPAAARL